MFSKMKQKIKHSRLRRKIIASRGERITIALEKSATQAIALQESVEAARKELEKTAPDMRVVSLAEQKIKNLIIGLEQMQQNMEKMAKTAAKEKFAIKPDYVIRYAQLKRNIETAKNLLEELKGNR